MIAARVLAVVAALAPAAHAQRVLNFGAATEFGDGLGAGLEIAAGGNALLLGAGSGPAGIGRAHFSGWSGYVTPGVAAGVRHYFGSWFLGPTLGLNRQFHWEQYAGVHDLGAYEAPWFGSAILDAGYRWLWRSHPGWNTRLGLGARWWPGHDVGRYGGLTLSVGFAL